MSSEDQSMGFFARYLTVWVLLCIVVGIALGVWVPSLFHALGDDFTDVTQNRLRISAQSMGA